jgi:hypothetical protein
MRRIGIPPSQRRSAFLKPIVVVPRRSEQIKAPVIGRVAKPSAVAKQAGVQPAPAPHTNVIKLTRLLSHAEKEAMDQQCIAKGWYREDRRMFTPGMGWYQPYYYTPDHWPEKVNWGGREDRGTLVKRGEKYLSKFYWENWSNKRPPICVVLPNGEKWEIDRKSSNGEGWKVEGEWPNITCSPSINATGYHGHLKKGEFTRDVERPQHPNGIWPYPNPLPKAGVRNAVAFEAPEYKSGDAPMPAGAYFFMINTKGRKDGFIHGCPCGCGARSAMWFEGEENAGGPKWSVKGEWPKVTLSPSIGIAKDQTTGKYHWHGYLEDGIFVER